jgi:hypothetical protein
MPIASMQSYSTVALNVRSTAFASQGQAMMLEQQVINMLQQKCSFVSIQRQGSGPPPDIILDLNITNTGRGSGSIISNSSTAFVDTLLVLSEGGSGELIGTARIHGTSSGMIINNNPPENEATQVIAKTIADMLAKSGCSGARIAKAPPPPVDNGQGSGSGTGSGTAPPDDAKRAQADALNQEGTDKLRSADVKGALAAYQQANALIADVRYQYNICLAYEAGQDWANAEAACKQAKTMTTEARMHEKIDKRLDLIAHKQ